MAWLQVLQARLPDGQSAFVYYDILTNAQNPNGLVQAVRGVNQSTTRSCAVIITRPSGTVLERSLAPQADVTVNIPKGRQFVWNSDLSADWTIGLSA